MKEKKNTLVYRETLGTMSKHNGVKQRLVCSCLLIKYLQSHRLKLSSSAMTFQIIDDQLINPASALYRPIVCP